MSKHRKKYEAAGGVVPLRWRMGFPPRDTVAYGNTVLAELWDANVGYGQKTICLSAEVVVTTLDHNGDYLWGGKPLGDRKVRRWCELRSVIHHRPLTLRDWPSEADDA